ncbi:MAG: hypothetical protein JWQ12_662 [Glaciihabitans sp.]|nr:hypothetical protein [Glaciihabitans sp.]
MADSPESPMIEATNDMIAAAKPWLTPLDAPAVAQLRILAAQLDSEPTAALATSYGTAYRALIKRAPATTADGDGLGALLREVAQ